MKQYNHKCVMQPCNNTKAARLGQPLRIMVLSNGDTRTWQRMECDCGCISIGITDKKPKKDK